MIPRVVAVTLVIVAVLLIASLGPFSDEVESRYATYAELRAGRYRGWIPDGVVPEDAVDIWEFHNFDTNARWGCFALTSGADPLRRRLQKLGAKRVEGGIGTGPTRYFRTRDWWPHSSEGDAAETYEYAESGGRNVKVGVLHGGSAACFRSTSR
jgi:hypothetical protein